MARTLWLPSGRRVRVDVAAREERASKREKLLFADVRRLLRTGRLSVEDAKTRAKLSAGELESMPLADFHVLRDFAIRSGAVATEPETFPCDNCDAELVFDGARLAVADLDDRYEDEPAAKEHDVPLPEPIRVHGGEVERVRMRPVTLAEVTPLHRALANDGSFRITPELIRAMGVVRLEGTVKVEEPRKIARALSGASDACWSTVESAFLDLAYPDRAITTIVCPSCETVHDLEVPWPRELDPGQYHPARDSNAPFPSAEEFEDHVARVAKTVFEKMGVAMTLRVEPGVPELDSGGVPMLGCYSPEPGDGGRVEFVVTLYYRTFERSFRDDPSFDWEHEVEETLEHEVQHHLYYLDGHDPMDESERKESEADAIRRAGGRSRYAQQQRAALVADAGAIVRVLGPILGLVAIATLLFLRCS